MTEAKSLLLMAMSAARQHSNNPDQSIIDALQHALEKMQELELHDDELLIPAVELLSLISSAKDEHPTSAAPSAPGAVGAVAPVVANPEFAQARTALAAALANSAEEPPVDTSYEYLRFCTGSFDPNKIIGSGAFGSVYRGVDANAGLQFAVKKLSDDFRAAGNDPARLVQQQRAAEREVSVLSRFRHPHIIRLVGFSFPDNGDRCLVYEMLPKGSVDALLRQDDTASELTWRVRVRIASGVLKGLNYMHLGSNARGGEAQGGGRCYHRDVKSANICLSADLSPQLIDCGLAKHVMDDGQGATSSSGGRFGTPGYKCPVYERNGSYDEKSEAFSFGMVLLELILGELQNARRDLYEIFVEEETEPLLEAFDARAGEWPVPVKAELASLAKDCLSARRPTRCDVREALQRLVRIEREHCQPTAEEAQLAAARLELENLRQRQSLEGEAGGLVTAMEALSIEAPPERSCYICFETFQQDLGLECVPAEGDAHFLCKTCLEGLVTDASTQMSMDTFETRGGVGCRHPGCTAPVFTDRALARHLSDPCFAAYIDAKGRLIERRAYADVQSRPVAGDAADGQVAGGVAAFEEAIERGVCRPCPNPDCDMKGLKNDDCTHMTWNTTG